MNTYETMKHNIPEGATHYRDGSDDFKFAWAMYDDGGELNVHTTALGWCRFAHSGFEAKVKPIPKDTSEEKETEPAYRYEKVTFEHAWEYFKLMSEDGDLYVNYVDSTFEGCYGDIINLANAIHDGVDLYRRIEVTEREFFIERCEGIKKAVGDAPKVYFGMIYDELVNGKG